jgi:hypothetical protein
VEHPAYKTATWDLKPASKGKAAVAQASGEPINIAYEIHGHGPIHLLVCPAGEVKRATELPV